MIDNLSYSCSILSFMTYPISVSKVYQNQFNTRFFDANFSNLEELKEITKKDWMPSLVDGYRSNKNFVASAFIYGDIDNEDQSNICSIEKFKEIFKDYEFYLITSRNHGKPKVKNDGTTVPAQDRYHVLFPLSEMIYDSNELDSQIESLVKSYSFFDQAAKGCTRFFYGNEDVQIVYNSGKKWTINTQEVVISEYVNPEKGEYSEESTLEYIMIGVKKSYEAGVFNNYHDWVAAGQAMKFVGLSVDSWKSITHGNVGNVDKKWESFNATKYTLGTLVHYARMSTPELLKPGFGRIAKVWDSLESFPLPVKAGEYEKLNNGKRGDNPTLGLTSEVKELPDMSRPAPISIFPHKKTNQKGELSILGTLENFEAMMKHYGITYKENLMTHKTEITISDVLKTGKYENASRGVIISLANLNGLPCKDQIDQYLITISHKNAYHPVEKWLDSLPIYDGNIDYIQNIADKLILALGYEKEYAKILLTRWLVSCVASIKEPSYYGRGVLTLQGPQECGKTTFFRNLIPDHFENNPFIEGLSLDPRNKDSVELAISHWVCELGELEGVFKRSDLAALKAFITKPEDTIRFPFERRAETYPRRTIFCATVNQDRFLVDETGNTRFWTIPIVGFTEKITKQSFDLSGIWSQALSLYKRGESWWLSPSETNTLLSTNKPHEEIDEMYDAIYTHYDIESVVNCSAELRVLTATQIAGELGFKNVTKFTVNKLAQALRKIPALVYTRRKNGQNGWLMPSILTHEELAYSSKNEARNVIPKDWEDDTPPF